MRTVWWPKATYFLVSDLPGSVIPDGEVPVRIIITGIGLRKYWWPSDTHLSKTA